MNPINKNDYSHKMLHNVKQIVSKQDWMFSQYFCRATTAKQSGDHKQIFLKDI